MRQLYATMAEDGVRTMLYGTVPRWEETRQPSVDLGMGPKWGRGQVLRGLRSAIAEHRRALDAVTTDTRRSGPVDVFHLHYKREQILLTHQLSALAPIVWTEHGLFPDGRGGRALTVAYRRAARSVAAVACVAPGVAEDIRARCGSRVRVEVIPNGVDTDLHRPVTAAERRAARLDLGLDADRPVWAVVSRLHPAKRVELALEACARRPQAQLVVAGTGIDESRLADLAGPTVQFLGHLSDPRPVYRAADVLLLPSGRRAREGLPMSMLEAAATGVPTVVCGDSGLGTLAEAAGGRVAEADPASLAACAVSITPENGVEARRWAEANNVAAATGRYIDLYRSVM